MKRHVLNTVATALLAMFLTGSLGLPMPEIAMATVFIVMQPQTRQVLHKSLYRLIGTISGAVAASLIGALFAQTPVQFLLALGTWVSVFTVAAALNKQLRAYSLVLTGYTPILIGVPWLFQLSHVGASAKARLAEVGIGLACSAVAMLVNGPRQPAFADGAAPPVPAGPAVAATLRMAPALVAGLHPTVAMLSMATLWRLSHWRGAPMAVLNATVDCALVALSASPMQSALEMSGGTLLAVAAGLLLQLAYPLASTVPHWLLLAPALALGAWLTGKSTSLNAGLGYGITLCMLASSIHPGDQYIYDGAGLVLSVLVLVGVCALLWPLRRRGMQS